MPSAPLTKAAWTALFRAVGMRDAQRRAWHAQFECDNPASHRDFLRSLEKNPDNRFKDAMEMQSELRELAEFLAEEARWGGEDEGPAHRVSPSRAPAGEPTQPLAIRAGRVTPT